jgi:serine/threonine protein phosphatase 1
VTITTSPSINPGDIIAVGDIHGRLDLLDLFLDRVRDSGATVILLGDMIDRGPNDLGVLNRVAPLLDDPESWGLSGFYALRGNHEKMFMDACDGYGVLLWVQNGGCLQDIEEMEPHLEWVSKLPIYMVVGDTMFVHAGVSPGHDPAKKIAEKKADDLVWMRQPFLKLGPMLGKWTDKIKRVVHGHTPLFEEGERGQPDISKKEDRIGIDCGAYFTGTLGSYNATQNTLFFDTINA